MKNKIIPLLSGMLGEKITTEITINKDAQGFVDNFLSISERKKKKKKNLIEVKNDK